MNRKIKISNKWETVEVKQPMAIHKYNAFMNGVDKSDQILNTNNVLRKCVPWWKTLFFHMIDLFFNWDSPHAKLNSHYEARSYKIKSTKKIAGYRKSV